MASAQLVEDAPVCQPQEPWTKTALLRVECAGAPPDGQEDLLHEFLGGRSLQTLQSQVKHQARLTAVERADRLVPAVRQLEHQLFIGTCRVSPRRGCRRGHCLSSAGVPAMRQRYRLFGVLIPAMLLA